MIVGLEAMQLEQDRMDLGLVRTELLLVAPWNDERGF
jgi:hypothetical protein